MALLLAEIDLSDAETALLTALIGVASALLIAAIGAAVNLSSAKRDRRRATYSEAVRAALAWVEMVFRVRRRSAGQAEELIARFHDMQENLSFYVAWIASDSRYMGRSYKKFVDKVKNSTGDLIIEAWDAPIRKTPGNRFPDDEAPDLSVATDEFLQDVRDHLSPWVWPRIRAAWRNRKGETHDDG